MILMYLGPSKVELLPFALDSDLYEMMKNDFQIRSPENTSEQKK